MELPEDREKNSVQSHRSTKARVHKRSLGMDPYHKKDIAALDRVQRKAARFCSQNYKQTASVTDMLADLGWDSLHENSCLACPASSHFVPQEAQATGCHIRVRMGLQRYKIRTRNSEE